VEGGYLRNLGTQPALPGCEKILQQIRRCNVRPARPPCLLSGNCLRNTLLDMGFIKVSGLQVRIEAAVVEQV
jgi:hypothetical protein